ncbi:MAG TPA: EF-P lysine aminoacylase EpmA [Gammaproteobacteria bacterium]|nr:EF-P lysine aminoacylase EpmA [Gammaproteobacteria bacterium]
MTYSLAAAPATLRLRADLLARIRAFFAARGVLEVETPALSSAGISDLALESVTARARSLGEGALYLHTSPEYAMKRLLASGSGDIYQLARVFRDDELGRWHQPEFTLLEWYRIGWDELRLMVEVEELLRDALAAAPGRVPRTLAPDAVRVTYAQACVDELGLAPTSDTPNLVAAIRARGIDVPPKLDHDAVLDLAFSTLVVPGFTPDAFTFVHDYPASQAALARLKAGTPPVAARFEVFARGIELANGFAELTDAAEQRRRFEQELDARRRAGREAPPLDEELLAALERLPPCAGVAIGVDRLVALAAGADSVAAAMSFAHTRGA